MRKLIYVYSSIHKAKAAATDNETRNSITTSHRQVGVQLSPGKQGFIMSNSDLEGQMLPL